MGSVLPQAPFTLLLFNNYSFFSSVLILNITLNLFLLSDKLYIYIFLSLLESDEQ